MVTRVDIFCLLIYSFVPKKEEYIINKNSLPIEIKKDQNMEIKRLHNNV